MLILFSTFCLLRNYIIIQSQLDDVFREQHHIMQQDHFKQRMDELQKFEDKKKAKTLQIQQRDETPPHVAKSLKTDKGFGSDISDLKSPDSSDPHIKLMEALSQSIANLQNQVMHLAAQQTQASPINDQSTAPSLKSADCPEINSTSTRLKPTSNRHIRRQEHWRLRLENKRKPKRDTPTTSAAATATPAINQHWQFSGVNSIESVSEQSPLSSAQWQNHLHSSATNAFISKHSVMEYFLMDKLRESSLREFEMFLKSH